MTVARKIQDKADSPKAEKKPTAADRTLSLYTGRTDLEDPMRARDGSLVAEKVRAPRVPRRKWEGGVDGPWELWQGSGKYAKPIAWIEREHGAYYARTTRRRLGRYESLHAATNAVEAAL